MEIAESYDMVEYLREYDDLIYGIPNARNPLVICPTIWNKTRTPEGKHTLYVYQFAPYNLRDGGPEKWDVIKDDITDGLLETSENRTTNMTSDNILGKRAFSPLDYARYNPSWPGGDFTHFNATLLQAGGNRPISGYNYKTPINKLYMCGCSTRPGWSVLGSARAAMWRVFEEIGLDFEKMTK